MYLTTGWPFLPLPWAQPRGPQVRGLCSPLPCAALIIAYRADGVERDVQVIPIHCFLSRSS